MTKFLKMCVQDTVLRVGSESVHVQQQQLHSAPRLQALSAEHWPTLTEDIDQALLHVFSNAARSRGQLISTQAQSLCKLLLNAIGSEIEIQCMH